MRLTREVPPRLRLALALLAGLDMWVAVVAWRTPPRPVASDAAQVWAASRAWLDGHDPYAVVGPGKPFDWPYPLLYPMTAMLAVAPVAWVPPPAADAILPALGVMAFVLVAPPTALWAVVSGARIGVGSTSQWSPLLSAAALTPWLGWVLACKPSIGAALWLAFPSRLSAGLIAAFLAVSIVAEPSWPLTWWGLMQDSTGHMVPPASYWGGPLLLLAFLRWRDPRARLLGVLACVPQTAVIYEAWPLFLIPRTHAESLVLVVASYAQLAGAAAGYDRGTMITLLLYLPCLVMVLREPLAAWWRVRRAMAPDQSSQ